MQFTIERSKWYRGHSHFSSALLREDGTKCCLGFLAESCGCSVDEIKHKSYFRCLDPEARSKLPIKIRNEENYFARVNDDPLLSDQQREEILTAAFRNLGIQVNFVD